MRPRIHTIRQIMALTRAVQEGLFHAHLVGIYRWDEVSHLPPKPVKHERGKPYAAGKMHDRIEMLFGPYRLLVLGPYEDDRYPCGLAKLTLGSETVEGMIDVSTWTKIADFIKSKRMDDYGQRERDRIAAGTDWGRSAGR